ncbi:MAG: SDR family oxidoreductase [Candidatus Binataceae bacterium]
MGRVDGKVVVITGAASGIGKQDALTLAREGARVVITDLNEDGGRALEKEIGDGALFVRHDISSEDNWKAVIAAAQSRFGRIDGLVNNAGILLMNSIEDTTLDQWQKVLRTNADGYFLGCKYGVAAMKTSGGGSIVNMSSVAAGGLPFAAAYSASKGAVAALTNSVAIHCRSAGYRIRCNSIHPDGVLTPMVLPMLGNPDPATVNYDADPTTRFCDPSDVANLVLFLISDESRFINGAQVRITNAY